MMLAIVAVLTAVVILLSVGLVALAAYWQERYRDVIRALDWVEKEVKTATARPQEGSSKEHARDRLTELERKNAHLWRMVESLNYRLRHREQVQGVIGQIKQMAKQPNDETKSGEQTKDD